MSYSYVSIKKAALNWVIRGESVYLRIKSVLPDIPYISNLSKMKKADLHVHSKYSNDGEFGIQDIIEMCELNGVGILSITDHNSVKGIKDALRLCEQSSLIFIPVIASEYTDKRHRARPPAMPGSDVSQVVVAGLPSQSQAVPHEPFRARSAR